MTTETAERRSRRGQQRYAEQAVTPIDQIRVQPNGVTGAWAYYLNPEGATIREALLLYPNGGQPSREDDPKGRYGTNAAAFRERQKNKGFEYLGQQLTSEAMRRVVETLDRNRDDYLLFLREEIDENERIRTTADSEKERAVASKRKAQYSRLLEQAEQAWDPDELASELNEIARAQRLARIDPNVLAVMREMVGEVNSKFERAVTAFGRGKSSEQDAELTGVKVRRGKSGAQTDFTSGADFIDAD